jgi:hypothetical protein
MLTQEQWLTSTDPAEMLRHLRRQRNGRLRYDQPVWFANYKKNLAPRKMRLFLLACCARLQQGDADPTLAQLLRVAGEHVESAPPRRVDQDVLHPFVETWGAALSERAGVVLAALRASLGRAAALVRLHLGRVARVATPDRHARMAAEKAAMETEARAQCELLRDIFGNPWCAAAVSPSWRSWNDGVVVRLAQAAYDQRCTPAGTLDNERLAVLADALEEAGCDNVDLLDHLRGLGPHVRGCWAIDLLLGKE